MAPSLRRMYFKLVCHMQALSTQKLKASTLSATFLNSAQKPVRPEQGIPVEAGSQTQVARRAKGGLVK